MKNKSNIKPILLQRSLALRTVIEYTYSTADYRYINDFIVYIRHLTDALNLNFISNPIKQKILNE